MTGSQFGKGAAIMLQYVDEPLLIHRPTWHGDNCVFK
jgi:hypothetical protein